MTTTYDVARLFLQDIGAPQSPGMTRAVAIWLRFEGSTIYGNNPWNLHSGPACDAERKYCPGQGSLPGQVGNRYAGTGDRNVAVFDTIDHGVAANARNLIALNAYGYPAVIAAARRDDPVGFLTAIQNSSWSAGHYSYSKLVSAWHSRLPYNFSITFYDGKGGAKSSGGDATTIEPGQNLFAWGDIVSYPVGHKLTEDDVNDIIKKLTDAGMFKQDNGLLSILFGSAPDMIASNMTRQVLMRHVGEEWNKDLEDKLQTELYASANSLTDNVFANLGKMFALLFDAENWLLIFALLAGIGLAAYGGKQLVNATAVPIGNITSEAS